jgi:DNA-binding Xre family transcriptional regulator
MQDQKTMQDTSPRTQVERWIADVCSAKGWKISEWAAKAEVSPNALYRFRSGQHKTISPKNLEKLHAAASRPT